MGSVKDLQVIKKPNEKELGIGRFVFSNRYSVFDWGEMPDHIENKGASLCLMGAYGFERAEEQGIRTHYRGLVRGDGKVVKLDELEEPTNIMEVSLVRVIHPPYEKGIYDYSMYNPELTNFLIPLEVIYRNGLPQGSSVFKRLKQKQTTIEELGLKEFPKEGQKLEKPIFDVSTKLEEGDRYINWEEAQKISGLKDDEVEEIKNYLSKVNNLITEITSKVNLVNEDGKIELAYNPQRELMVVDVVNTLDECRFTFDGINVSKEIARQYYKGRNDWYKDVISAKQTAKEKKDKDWKKFCQSQPSKLSTEIRTIFENVYKSTTNAFLKRNIFDCPSLDNVVKKYRELLSG